MKADLPEKGILGLGKASTLYYLSEVQSRYKEQGEEYSTLPFLMYQIDFQEINSFLPNQFSVLIPKIEHYIAQLSKLGISKLLVPNITLHETLDQIEFTIEICHPIQLTIDYLKKEQISEVFIFGTAYTMNSSYLKKYFSESNIVLKVPDYEDQQLIDNFRKLVYEEKASPAEILDFQNLIQKYSEKNLVVIACTELSVFAPKNETNCVDMVTLQTEEFLK
ncbi:aspartate/glutamate racemase family protein [Kaistella polysaccharea]|uniref:aspartate/glutamate racemase family protein n=1 Tax=Kaistella polysaccharea TaxID=2878534 RepID=UPI001CF28A00|nr:aspartate/glutamate racemase family protein [Kaistella polysaccharea]